MKNKLYISIICLLISVCFIQCDDEGYDKINSSCGYRAYLLQNGTDEKNISYRLYIVVDSFITTKNLDRSLAIDTVEITHDNTLRVNKLQGNPFLWISDLTSDVTKFNGRYQINAKYADGTQSSSNFFYIENDTVAIIKDLNIRDFSYDGKYIKGTVDSLKHVKAYGFIFTRENPDARIKNIYCDAKTSISFEKNEYNEDIASINLSYEFELIDHKYTRPVYVRIYARTSEGVYLESNDYKTISEGNSTFDE